MKNKKSRQTKIYEGTEIEDNRRCPDCGSQVPSCSDSFCSSKIFCPFCRRRIK